MNLGTCAAQRRLSAAVSKRPAGSGRVHGQVRARGTAANALHVYYQSDEAHACVQRRSCRGRAACARRIDVVLVVAAHVGRHRLARAELLPNLYSAHRTGPHESGEGLAGLGAAYTGKVGVHGSAGEAQRVQLRTARRQTVRTHGLRLCYRACECCVRSGACGSIMQAKQQVVREASSHVGSMLYTARTLALPCLLRQRVLARRAALQAAC